MAGAVPPNIRKADFAEDLGRLLLRPFCALSPVESKDDFGIDTIATLLEIDENSHLRHLATANFAVQFKAKSVKEIPFTKNYQAKWLTNLEFPYFIGSVDLDTASMDLFTINYITSLPEYDSLDSFILHLDSDFEKDGENRFSLGEPILRTTISDLNNEARIKENRAIIREWIKCDFINIRQRNLGQTSSMHWNTNKLPSIQAGHKMLKSGGENMKVLRECAPFSDAMLSELRLFNSNVDLLKSVDIVAKKLKQLGIKLDTYEKLPFDELREKLK